MNAAARSAPIVDALLRLERHYKEQARLAALDIAAANRRLPAGYAYCPRCDIPGPTIDDGATCAHCKLVLP